MVVASKKRVRAPWRLVPGVRTERGCCVGLAKSSARGTFTLPRCAWGCANAASRQSMTSTFQALRGRGNRNALRAWFASPEPPAANSPAWPESPRSPAAPCLAVNASRAMSQTHASTALRPVQRAGYSVCNECVLGLDSATVWCATQGGGGFHG